MPDRTYSIEVISASMVKAAADAEALKVAIIALDAAVTQLAPKLKALGKGSAGTIGALAKAIAAMNANLAASNTTAGSAAASVRRYGSAASYAAGTTKGASTAAQGLGRAFGAAAKNGVAASSAVKGLGAAAAAATPNLQAAAAAAAQLKAANSAVKTSANSAGTSIGRMVGAGMLIKGVHLLARGLADAMNDAREYAEKAARDLHEIGDEVRELRAIKGGNTDETVAGVADLMIKTGAKKNEAIAFETMFESALPAAKNLKDENGKPMWELSDKETKEVKEESLKFAIANGIDPAVMGRMIPAIGTFGKVKTKDDVMGQLGMIHQMGVEAVGRFTPVMKDFNTLVGSTVNAKGGGAVKTPAELVGLISAVTVTSGTEAKAIAQITAAWKELSFANNDEKTEAFNKLGIVPGKDDYVGSIEKMKPLLVEGRKAGKSDTQTLDDAGFHLDAARRAIIKQVATADDLRAKATEATTKIDPTRVLKINKDFAREQPQRFADAAKVTADLERGKEEKTLITARDYAQAGMTRNNEIERDSTNFGEKFITAKRLGGILGETGRESGLDSEIRARLKASVPGIEKRFPDMDNLGGGWFGEGTFAEGKDLAAIINQLSPKEHDAFMQEMGQFGTTGHRGMGPRAQRPAAAINPGAAAPKAVGPQAGLDVPRDNRLVAINDDQLRVLNRIDRKLDRGPARAEPGGFGALPDPGGDFGPMRS